MRKGIQEETERTRVPIRRLRGRRTAAASIAGLAAVLAIVTIAAPLASAHGVVSIVAPYNHFSVSTSSYAASYGCGKQSLSTSPSWDGTTGVYSIAGKVSIRGCSGSNGAEIFSYVALTTGKFSAPQNGFGYLVTGISSAFSARAALHVPAPSNGTNFSYSYATVTSSATVYLYDNNGTFVGYQSVSFFSQTFTATGSFSLTQGPTSTSLYIWASFVAGHQYYAYIDFSASAYLFSYDSMATGSASIDLAGGNGITLTGLTAA